MSPRPRLAAGIWVPLCVSDESREEHFGHPHYWSDYNGVRTFAAPLQGRKLAEELEFSNLAAGHRHYAHGDKYYPAETVLSHAEEPIGVNLALIQSFDGDGRDDWSLNQDLVFALSLQREDDSWRCPSDGFAEVAQLRRDAVGRPTGIYIKPEYLRDYLPARKMALRIVQLRQRRATMRKENTLGWSEDKQSEARDGGTFSASAWPVGGESVMVMRMGRTDKWDEDELPEMGPPSDDNTVSEQHEFTRPQPHLYSVEGDFRREEWLEPAEISPRVRRDDAPSSVTFVVDGAGTRQSADELNDEDIGKWLWFKPGIISEVLSHRGASLAWYTLFTGGIQMTAGYSVHFGLNRKEFVVVYARDVARLPEWQRLIWAGFNVAPDGGLPGELEQAQVGGEVADTLAPEAWFERAIAAVDTASVARWGWPLFHEHASTKEIGSKIHRYRALDDAGFLALAKDIARLTADSIDVAKTQSVLVLAKGEKLGSLKSLERALSTIVSGGRAKAAMTVLVGVYDLRLGDAHLPSEKLKEAFALAGVPYEEPALSRAAHLIHNVVAALFEIAKIIDPGAQEAPRDGRP